jgi:phosphoribosylaminoimidazolecarboxamide formyltransferase/IMP cyclohydrolase
MDADAALETVREFERPAVVFVKHANPCGTAVADSLNEAFVHAYECDSKSAFGGIIAMNRPCTEELAESIVGNFFEIVIAPSFESASLEAFSKKPNLRILSVGEIKHETGGKMYRRVSGGLLIQEADTHELLEKDVKVVTRKAPTPEEMRDLLFAWRVVKHVKSNAIVLAKNGMTVGIGAGQMSRVDAVELAIKKALDRQDGSVMASDAFFPFPDNVEAAAKAGITAIIQPGGSVKDDEVTAAADKAGIAMVFTGVRAFLH